MWGWLKKFKREQISQIQAKYFEKNNNFTSIREK